MIALQLLVVEGVLQLYYRATSGDWLLRRAVLPVFAPDEHRAYKVKPNLEYRHRTNEFDVVYYTNDLGFRSDASRKTIAEEKPDDTIRILLMGPSFSFGVAGNYEDIYATRFANSLQVPGKKIEIINLGTPGQPPAYQLCWLKSVAPRYQPDMVIQTVYGEPEKLATGCRFPEQLPVIEDGFLYTRTPSPTARALGYLKQSAVVFYLWYVYQALLPETEAQQGLGTELYEVETTNAVEDGARPALPQVRQTFNDYIDYVRQHLGDVEIAFLHVPFSFTVRPADIRRWSHLTDADPQLFREQAELVSDTLNYNYITYINPLPKLIERDQKERTYYFLNIHFTPAGNEALAEAAVPVLQDILDQRFGPDTRRPKQTRNRGN